MKGNLLIIGILVSFSASIYAQEEGWKPRTNNTGYIALEGNYLSDIQYYDREYGMAISEAGLLTSYMPIEKLTIKSVFVYRPNLSIDQMLNEANAEYKIKDFLNLKGGRFLVPLSPMNTYYYAPVNNSATLPMLIQNHEFFPLNMDGLSFNGSVGEDINIKYDAFAGGFKNFLWIGTGALGFFGTEYDYFQRIVNMDTTGYSETTANVDLQFGMGGHVDVSYEDYITIGAGIFSSSESITSKEEEPDTGQVATSITHVDKLSYGVNLKIKLATLQLLSEYWKTTVTLDFGGMDFDMDYYGAFVELSNTFGKFIPYIRYEYHERPTTAQQIDYYRYTGGINYKPIFEVCIKLEYIYYDYQSLDLSGLVGTVIYSF